MAEILILTDRPEGVPGAADALARAGHRVAFGDPADPLDPAHHPDIVLVDAVKNRAVARDACRAIRLQSERVTIVAVVAADDLGAVGADWGMDTFLVDGAPADEVLARVRLAHAGGAGDDAVIRVGELQIDPDTYQVRLRGRPLDLTYKEFQLLAFLAHRPGRVFSRSQLLQEVWGYDFFGGTRTVDVHVRRLRAKLGAEHEALIATVRNVGYKLEPPARGRP